MGDLVCLEDYRRKIKEEEDRKTEEEVIWLKKKLEDMIKEKTISVYPEDEYYHWHPPNIISRYDCEDYSTWGDYFIKLDDLSGYDWENPEK